MFRFQPEVELEERKMILSKFFTFYKEMEIQRKDVKRANTDHYFLVNENIYSGYIKFVNLAYLFLYWNKVDR